MNTIKVEAKQVYGNELIYITDADQQKHLQQLTGCKTLTSAHIVALKGLGFEFEWAERGVI